MSKSKKRVGCASSLFFFDSFFFLPTFGCARSWKSSLQNKTKIVNNKTNKFIEYYFLFFCVIIVLNYLNFLWTPLPTVRSFSSMPAKSSGPLTFLRLITLPSSSSSSSSSSSISSSSPPRFVVLFFPDF